MWRGEGGDSTMHSSGGQLPPFFRPWCGGGGASLYLRIKLKGRAMCG